MRRVQVLNLIIIPNEIIVLKHVSAIFQSISSFYKTFCINNNETLTKSNTYYLYLEASGKPIRLLERAYMNLQIVGRGQNRS